MRESTIEHHLVQEVEKRGGLCYKLSPIGRVNKPDRLVILKGRMVFVECKAPGQKPREGQLREHERLRKLGHEVYMLDSKNVDFLDNKIVADYIEEHGF